jgi:hypothetical protein
MNYGLRASAAAPHILHAASERCSPDEFGAVDAILCLVAANPSTPDSELRAVAGDSDLTIRALVQRNPG